MEPRRPSSGEAAGTIDGGGPGRHETAEERLDRNLNQLLGELRVTLPGVQVLFAFLLTVPFSQRFAEISEFERYVYFGVLLCTALSSVLLMAPTAFHRMLFRQGRMHDIVFISHRLVIIGLVFLALAMTSAIFLITHVLFGPAAAIPTAAAAAATFGGLWYLLPWVHSKRDER